MSRARFGLSMQVTTESKYDTIMMMVILVIAWIDAFGRIALYRHRYNYCYRHR